MKKGSIVPQMPVMQYIHEDKGYPLLVHIFPNNEDENASFELYEDDGENLDYLKGISSKTQFVCTTLSDGYKTIITPNDNGFVQSDKRNIVLIYHLENKPNSVTIDDRISAQSWIWDDVSKECRITIPDKRKNINIVIR